MSFDDFKKSARRVARNANGRDQIRKIEKYEERARMDRAAKSKADRAAVADPYLEIPNSVKLDEKYIDGVANNRRFNEQYSDYYTRMANDFNLPKLHIVAAHVQDCHRYWFGDHYRLQRVFDVKRVHLCHDKFCTNCQRLKQASRLKRFTPILEELSNNYNLYHTVFTLPNVSGSELARALDIMHDAFRKITRYLSGDAPIKGLDFSECGYAGAVRCFEIVANPTDYHPHIHSLFVLSKEFELVKTIVNDYSYNYGVYSGRKFSELEVLIQKIMYLVWNNQKVTLENISAVPIGYSCTMDKVEGNEWHEVFKYVTKLTKNGAPALTYEQFVTLYNALHKRRVMQGYGILFNVAKDDTVDEAVAEEYEKILAKLRLVELPDKEVDYVLDRLVADIHSGAVTVISKRNIQRYLNELAKEEDSK